MTSGMTRLRHLKQSVAADDLQRLKFEAQRLAARFGLDGLARTLRARSCAGGSTRHGKATAFAQAFDNTSWSALAAPASADPARHQANDRPTFPNPHEHIQSGPPF